MSKLTYKDWKPGPEARSMVANAETICVDYANQGYDLTLRQLYYQFVSRGLLDNNQAAYGKLGDVINKARLAGLLDWSYIVDRTRNLETQPHWVTPIHIINSVAQQFDVDRWTTQPRRVEVWVEKEALAGIVGQAADALDTPWFSCRGYVSQSEQWAAGQRLLSHIERGQAVTVLHLGDHDPSGIDMTRDTRSLASAPCSPAAATPPPQTKECTQGSYGCGLTNGASVPSCATLRAGLTSLTTAPVSRCLASANGSPASCGAVRTRGRW